MILNEERIKVLYERFQKKANKYNDEYQQSGIPQMYSEYQRQAELAELCKRALTGASDHDDALHYRMILYDLGTKAYDAIHKNELDDYRNVVKEIAHYMRITGICKNKWE